MNYEGGEKTRSLALPYILLYTKQIIKNLLYSTEENNRMGKTRDLFKKIRDTQGTFHVKMGPIKDRNNKDLTKAEEVARIYRTIQKYLTDPDNHSGMITLLQPDILECEFKWALGSITMNKAS